MKRLLLTICLVTALFVMVAPEARALTLQLYQGSYSYGNGGEFVVVSSALDWVLPFYSSSTKYGGGFASFCLETSETFVPGAIYNYAISDKAMFGSMGSQGDPISIGTAWLYSQFAAGTLDKYNYGAGRLSSAGALQAAIWWLENEAGAPGADNIFINMVMSLFDDSSTGSINEAMANSNGAYGVAVLNITDDAGGRHQDQLVLVPEPVTLLLLGLGLVGLAGIRRKFRK